MKNFLLAMLLSVTFTANAAVVTSAIDNAGSIVFYGGVYIDNDVEAGQGARGIADVNFIRDTAGNDLWNDSTSELSIIFYGFTRSNFAQNPLAAGEFLFTSVGGSVEFWENDLGTFQSTDGFDIDSAVIRSAGTSQLLASGQIDSNGNAVIGSFNTGAYSSNGYLSVYSGNWFNMLNTNSILDPVSGVTFADMTFNLSGDNIATGGYSFSGSGDIATLATNMTVPEPSSLALMGIGLAGFGFVRKRKT